MTHQEGLIRLIAAALNQPEEVRACFKRGNPFDKLLRSYDEFTADGKPLYRNKRAVNHYRLSVKAYSSGLPYSSPRKEPKLYGEHRIPLKIIRERLLACDGSIGSIRNILEENEVVLIHPDEQKYVDSSVAKGGLGFSSSMPSDGTCRFEKAGIRIAHESLSNRL